MGGSNAEKVASLSATTSAGAGAGPRLIMDAELRSRAQRVIPGGMYGHQAVANLPPHYPQFFVEGKGARIRDANGVEYIDLMCSYGPMVLGHRNPVVEQAVRRQMRRADCLNGPTEHMVRLAELLTQNVPHADWALFCKNGTDATTLCVTIARAATKRRKVMVARGAYHGWAAWCNPNTNGITEEERSNILYYEYNDLDSVIGLLAEHGADLAAIVASPMRHDIKKDLLPVDPEFARRLRTICDQLGAALILDDVRCAMRVDLRGSWEPIGVRPDLSAWSKAIANGYPIACVLGSDRFRDAASSVYATGSFWFAAVPMVAALATIEEATRIDAIEMMRVAGQRLRDGLASQARSHGLAVTLSGTPQLPFMTFAGDGQLTKSYLWADECVKRGVYLHPFHNWFLSAAHTAEDISRALDATDDAFGVVVKQFGRD